VVDDFIETMTIERNKQKINKMLNAKKIQDWIDKIKTTEKDPKYYEQALLLYSFPIIMFQCKFGISLLTLS
jgi:hypothetical protein